jgi:hypothetical protein
MSQIDQDLDLDDDDDDDAQQGQQAPPQGQQDSDQFRNMRKKANKADRLERENALLRAGIDLESDLGSMFAKGYDGPLEVAAMREAATKVGAYKPPEEPKGEQQQQQSAQQQDQQGDQQDQQQRTGPDEADQRGMLQHGAPPDTGAVADPRDDAIKAGKAKIGEGASEEEGVIEGFRHLVEAGVSGDQRVLHQEFEAAESQRKD